MPHIHGIISFVGGVIHLLKTQIQRPFPFVVLNFPPTRTIKSKQKYKDVIQSYENRHHYHEYALK